VVVAAMDRYFGNVVWSQHINYRSRGAGIYLLQEGARFLAVTEEPPQRQDVLVAANSLLTNRETSDAGAVRRVPEAHRNIHMIVLETFWDPSSLKAARFSRDPLVREFRELWDATGNSKILSPVTGGYTANAEFEALCGFPVDDDAVKFERQLRNDVPCLPRILNGQGYTTVASHPNVPVFWNRNNAYRRLGFDTFWSKGAFELDDMNRNYLADESLYRQVFDKLSTRPEAARPLFNYILTIFGHWDYPLNAARPPVVESASSVPLVGAYANTVWYKSREFMQMLSDLRARDPDALIVAFGDHRPMLGVKYAGYVESGLLNRSRSDFTPVMYERSVTTPLLIIDGRNGPLDVGTIPLYVLPGVVLRLLGYRDPTIMDLAASPPPGLRVRPLPGLHLNVTPGRVVEQCVAPYVSPSCVESGRWLAQLRVVAADLFVGKQFLLQ
jgi:hypothetical protein